MIISTIYHQDTEIGSMERGKKDYYELLNFRTVLLKV